MGILAGLEPEKVFQFFEEICGIPHGSGNITAISNYLVAFAKERGLFCTQDAWQNVIIIQEATPGYEKEPPIILQGHMDMVAVSDGRSAIDMTREGLRLAVDGDRIYARSTSLGGDDGIAIAYALAILDSNTVQHPRLEVVLTVDEEVGMEGARNIDLSMLQARRMLNLDSEEEGIFLASCAGGARVNCSLPYEREKTRGILCQVALDGLLGGHSGTEIHRERGNANVLMIRVLKKVTDELPVRLVALQGGQADNAIATNATMTFLLPVCEESGEMLSLRQKLEAIFVRLREIFENEYTLRDPALRLAIHIEDAGLSEIEACTVEDTRRLARALYAMPNGVQAMSRELEGLVETSLNLGILRMDDVAVIAQYAVRSSVESAKYALIDKLGAIVDLAKGNCTVSGDYPGWQYRLHSPLRDKMLRVYEHMYGQKPKVEAVHAGLECGLLADKIPDFDCVSLGPQISDIHTTQESLSISSVARVWDFLVELLACKD